ncbi:2-succinyl-6-hydroxy-2,4-cyclohexadiene-1- carboxylate synthase [Planococcus halocryophilus Or1]|uniref:Putative 2-succinyl-6-hydroxy-2,4-cyclohexadiene-1-carboxylate synthase n=1 Tax=Planococcus halocryophilus TaxID=1215089 RepID=A0A1C7DM08_9BACL|nr:2-succinyl-6-hydroxy-2,4-cyclohexadiene-1-carboxylate synthase [Planococcus halocryophilus]ANU12619.1 2-succinyl-6-hydroxy-2,4-cyclohexadiene-1-carboxylate synthase [Planococcus halocryophilus]EMF47181.1 2-succinyl-6-hydroxy-2,4-cyclohexadiene-1- carboxylate synthase [Planococcus halocryophilus Or1]
MKLEVGGNFYHVEVRNPEKPETLVFLHGFTGSTKTWHSVSEKWTDAKIVLIDLIGHGASSSPEELKAYSMERQLEDLDALFDQLALDNFTLVGYSMGGRTALAYACNYPERLTRLVLESASPGLDSEQARKDRRTNDARLAERIVTGGLVNFVDAWENIELFASQKELPERVQQSVREERLAQNPLGLANSLHGMGTGAQQSYWQELKGLNVPVLLVTGRLDVKFEAIAQKMLEQLPNAVHKTIDAGHAIHVEKPAEFATIVREYLSLNYQGGKS